MKRSVRATGRSVARIFNIGDGHREAFFRCISRLFTSRTSLPRTSMRSFATHPNNAISLFETLSNF
jgi:hypothetical protein